MKLSVRSLAARHSHFSLSHFCHDRLPVGALLFQFNHPDYASIFLCHSYLAALNFATLLLSTHLQCPKSEHSLHPDLSTYLLYCTPSFTCTFPSANVRALALRALECHLYAVDHVVPPRCR